jgi:hypothetical protein
MAAVMGDCEGISLELIPQSCAQERGITYSTENEVGEKSGSGRSGRKEKIARGGFAPHRRSSKLNYELDHS